MSGGHGPTGSPPPPPSWLKTSSLPILELPKATSVVRVHRTEYDPVFFSPGSGNAPIGRFDSPSGAFGVLYLAQALEGAFAETILRNPQRRLADLSEITTRAASVLGVSRAIRLVKMFGAGLQSLGTDNAVSTGPYVSSGAWADALFAHPDAPDGIAYTSRHDSEQLCIALFSRPGIQLELLSGPTQLSDVLADVASILRRYGKGIA
jgi:RES domain